MSLRKFLFITAANRPAYFRETMNSWRKARGFYDWNVVVRLEPSEFVAEHLQICKELEHEKLTVMVNPQVYGVLHHPWEGFNDLFKNGYVHFVVRAEDDLIVADDILEYFDWAADRYASDKEIAAVVGYTDEISYRPQYVRRSDSFSPWVWGTWSDRWEDFIRDTWDHDYSTFNGAPGNQAGWDWNLDTRVLPSLNKKIIAPAMSRVQNIGVWGVHGRPENFKQAASFYENFYPAHAGQPMDYQEA
jgi:hypothetical protein